MTATLPARAPIRDLYRGMNQLEKKRAIELEAKKRVGAIVDWWYERLTLKLADDCRYTPDFLVQENDGTLRLEEVKGHWRDDAKAKCRMCADRYPFQLDAFEPSGQGWIVTTFAPC